MILKSDMPNHVSSTLMMVFFDRSNLRKPRAKCWRRIKFLGLLPYHEVALILLYRMFNSNFMILLMVNGLTSIS